MIPLYRVLLSVAVLLPFSCSLSAQERAMGLSEISRGRSSLYDGELVRFVVDEHPAFLLRPTKTTPTKAWVWYAPTLLADIEKGWKSPGLRHAWIFNQLLSKGINVAGVDVGESYGNSDGRAIYDRFYRAMVREPAFSTRPGLLAISRGGLMSFNWAAERPDAVGCIGGIYPLCNLREYSGSGRPALGRIAEAYQLSETELRQEMARHNPVERLRPLADARIPLFLIHGDADQVVPVESHSGELARRYRALNGPVQLVVVAGKGHEITPEYWEDSRLIEFFVSHLLAR